MAQDPLPLIDRTQDVRVLAFYRLPEPALGTQSAGELPEWQNVLAARPLFPGHEQPVLPGELGCCDARDAATRQSQAALAAAYGVSGFCYTFGGLPDGALLDPTLADILASGVPSFPFCVCWETTASNAGAGFGADDAPRHRYYSRDECVAVVRALHRIFSDPRYVRVAGRPLFIVSSPDPIRDVRQVAASWREE